MINIDTIAFKDYILSKNTYFDKGYANAFKDENTSGIYVRDNSSLISLFPNDRLGNYFYLRNDTTLQFTLRAQENLTDFGLGRLGFLDTMTVYLVAIVKNADVHTIINNLRNTAMMYNKISVVPISAIWNREQIVIEELRGLEPAEIAGTLQRLKNEIIVRLQFTISNVFAPSKCIDNPCKC